MEKTTPACTLIDSCQSPAGWVAEVENPEAALIEANLRHRLGGRGSWISVSRKGAGLVLAGHARSYYVKQLAQHAVMAITTLPILANEIAVASPGNCF